MRSRISLLLIGVASALSARARRVMVTKPNNVGDGTRPNGEGGEFIVSIVSTPKRCDPVRPIGRKFAKDPVSDLKWLAIRLGINAPDPLAQFSACAPGATIRNQ